MTTEQVVSDEVLANAPAQAREHIKRLEDENAGLRTDNTELRKDTMERHLATIGLEEATGLGKVIAREYDGDFTADGVATYAKDEYGHEYTPPAEEVADVSANPQADEIAAGQQALDQVQGASSPAEPAPLAGSIEELERRLVDPEATRDDAKQSIAAKTAEFRKRYDI